MMRKLMTYGVLGLFAALIGFMIGGGPGALRSAPVPSTPVPASTVSPDEPTASSSTSSSTTSSPSTTTSSTTTAPASTSSTTSSTTTSPTTTTTPPLTTAPPSTEAEEIDRGAVDIGVANASRALGAAGRLVDRLTALGYASTTPFDAADAPETLIYHSPELVAQAEQLALDLGLTIDDLRPLAEVPELFTSRDYQIVVVLGFEAGGEIPSEPLGA